MDKYSFGRLLGERCIPQHYRQEELEDDLNYAHSQSDLRMEKFKDLPTRLCYAQQAIVNGWSRDTLTSMIKNRISLE